MDMRKKKVKQKIYIIDNCDGQIICLSGDRHFFLIEVTDMYSKKRKSKN